MASPLSHLRPQSDRTACSRRVPRRLDVRCFSDVGRSGGFETVVESIGFSNASRKDGVSPIGRECRGSFSGQPKAQHLCLTRRQSQRIDCARFGSPRLRINSLFPAVDDIRVKCVFRMVARLGDAP